MGGALAAFGHGSTGVTMPALELAGFTRTTDCAGVSHRVVGRVSFPRR
jgi:hypothetical protein